MKTTKRRPIVCTVCGRSHTCTCKFCVTTINWKLRQGLCKECEAEARKESN